MLYNYGSINLDHVYRVSHLVRPGETLASHEHRVGLGGKGANQSLALAKAGGQVQHWGCLNAQDGWARELLQDAGVDVAGVKQVPGPSGHAIIQVDDSAENAILLFPGANHHFKAEDIAELMQACSAGDWLLLQNECSVLADSIQLAHQRGVQIAFNPAPMSDDVKRLPLHLVDLLFVNRGEAAWLAECEDDASAETLLDALAQQLPTTALVLTLGAEGAWYQHGDQRHFQPASSVKAVDTTAAGDTFIGYYLAAMQEQASVAECLALASTAAALGVQRQGAATSVPARHEVDSALSSGQHQIR
ncbi:ribokinase [Halomonas denitrificans]|uniref:ribokinase n=1 Tax=Halomonas denitrificans TaxID=370769 RepID=UPI001CD1B282|nr:ribokinase [Halomonas denitrificans]MCA0973695.1 ribokinase [Halomonas denitrificans]